MQGIKTFSIEYTYTLVIDTGANFIPLSH